MGINEALGQWSDLFMVLAAMTYLVSFVAFAWDMASSSKVLRRAEERAQHTRQRQLAHHGGSVAASAEPGCADVEGSGG